jgi:hypothetical protein
MSAVSTVSATKPLLSRYLTHAPQQPQLGSLETIILGKRRLCGAPIEQERQQRHAGSDVAPGKVFHVHPPCCQTLSLKGRIASLICVK